MSSLSGMDRRKILKVALKWHKIASIPKIVSIKLKQRKSFALSETDDDEEMWRTPLPQGHVTVYAGKEERTRFAVPVGYLNHPVFRELLHKAEEEFGFNYHDGRLTIPCNPSVLDSVIHRLKDWEEHPLDMSDAAYGTTASSSYKSSDVHRSISVH